MKQNELLYKYNDTHREKFNKELFMRDENEIIEGLKNIILSCQRSRSFIIKVLSFRVIEDYNEVNRYLYEYEENKNKTKNKNSKVKRKENIYEYINLKDSDIKLLIVRYYLKIKEEEEILDVIIAIPRIVDKYYFRLNGNTYSAIYQIVDASTYNNSTSNSKKHSVTLKTIFGPVRIYRQYSHLSTTKKEKVNCVYYSSNIFNKSAPALKYILAKFGYYKSLDFLFMRNMVLLSDKPMNDDNMYTFARHESLYISVPKVLFDSDNVVQSFVYTVYKAFTKNTTYEEALSDDFWVRSLGQHFNNASVEKGLSVLDSLDKLYDIPTRSEIHLPDEYKKDIFCILRWMIGEFSNLKIKDNLDISTKKIRISSYIASLYAAKLSNGIYRVSDLINRAEMKNLRRSVSISPMYLLGEITKCNLVNYRNMVNDTDSIIALKFTYKGISSLGNKKNAVPDSYRAVNISHIGRVDLDSSSPSDPGFSGTICPLTKTYNGYFSNFEEPNSWVWEINKLIDNYKATVGIKEAIMFENEVLGGNKSSEVVDESLDIMKDLLIPVRFMEEDDSEVCNEIELEEGGKICYE